MSERKESTLYNPTQQDYSFTIQKHNEENDIVDTIQADLFDTTNIGDVIRIRNEQNDDLFPFNATAFIQWFDINPTHPLTRERLDYIRPRIDFKKKCIEQLPRTEFKGLTPEYTQSLLHEFKSLMVKRYVTPGQPWTSSDDLKLLECQAYLDLSAWENAGHIFKKMDYTQTQSELKTKPVGTWMIRKSSQHANVMKNSDIVVIGSKKVDRIYQVRLLYVHGVGWYIGSENMPIESFHALREARNYPDHITWCHALEHFISSQTCHMDKLFIP